MVSRKPPFDIYRKLINRYKPEDINFTQYHVQDRLRQRKIDSEHVRKTLFDTDNLVDVREESTLNKGERKFATLYFLSNRYDMGIVVVFTEREIFVVSVWEKDKKFNNIFKRY